MISKTKRGLTLKRGNIMLGPGRYNTIDRFAYKKKEDTRYYAFNFERIQHQAERNNLPMPGPGQY